ncbi:hypothetical protein ACX84U_34490, partial [Burkholderia pseudomallei]
RLSRGARIAARGKIRRTRAGHVREAAVARRNLIRISFRHHRSNANSAYTWTSDVSPSPGGRH